jgi:capsular polysaccharide export protein
MVGDIATFPDSAGPIPRRLFTFSGGFITQRRLRRILQLSGHQIRLGRPGAADGVVVWGQSDTARRGQAVAKRLQVPLIRIEDAFLRSLRPGRMGDAPLGLLIDPVGIHYDATRPSLIELCLRSAGLQDSNLVGRATDGIARLRYLDLSKYNLHDPTLDPPDPGYVLVIDQTRNDASLRASGADRATFLAMLARAKADHPDARIVVKAHPETTLGLRPGHFGADVIGGNVTLLAASVSPWRLLDGAIAVYTVSSQLGFEAILAGIRPHVFGTPFYAGWGLSHDEIPQPRRTKTLTAPQLFAAAMILAPTWYDPCRDRLCPFEEVLDQLEAETRSHRADKNGYVATGMRAWKRRHLQAFFGGQMPLRFVSPATKAAQMADKTGRGLLIWAAKEPVGLPAAAPITRVEDGFLRSRGLGANLVPPLSLITDDLGIYYDPTRPSRLEALIAGPLPPGGAKRAQRLIDLITQSGTTKYNLGHQTLPDLPKGHRILVPGQVEDDASIIKGATNIRTNLSLLRAARAANPSAVLIYKPHPDVEAGLRPGAISDADLANLADVILRHADAAASIASCDAVWTITSTLGFEALLRGKPVTCLGVPFYAGWGLTKDHSPIPQRRRDLAKTAPDGVPIDLIRLVHAALISYPRYFDPTSQRACSPEIALDRLITGPIPRPGASHRALAKLQGYFAGFAYLWR